MSTATAAAAEYDFRHHRRRPERRAPANYSVEQCLMDWLETLNTQAEITVTGYRIMARHLTGLIGNVKLADLKVRDGPVRAGHTG